MITRPLLLRVAATLLSGVLLALATSLHPLWPAAWVALVPVLVASHGRSPGTAFWMGLGAGLIGGSAQLGFFLALMPLPVALLIWVIQALIVAGGLGFASLARGRLPAGLAVFALPCWSAAVDLLAARFSANGTAGSLAYSQMELPAVLQVASLGGVAAVTFTVLLFASAAAQVAAGGARGRALLSVAPALLLVLAALGFGQWRIASAAAEPTVPVALAALDPDTFLPRDWRAALDAYRPLVAQAGAARARVLVLPEEIALAPEAELPEVQGALSSLARREQLTLALGLRLSAGERLRNVLVVSTPDGRGLVYDKQHLVPGLEIPKITPGPGPVLLAEVDGLRLGGAICKDFDFIDIGRSLGEARAGLVVAPAWDFGRDAWLHGRMAVLRAVEGGFSLVRSAREGDMTVSDRFGRVTAEAPSGPRAPLLLAQATVAGAGPTVYARVGDLFGWLAVALLPLFLVPGKRARAGA